MNDPVKVHEVPLLVTLLVASTTAKEADALVESMSLDRIAQEMDDGQFVGTMRSGGQTLPVPKSQLDARLESMGSSGDFFGYLFEDDPVDMLATAVVHMPVEAADEAEALAKAKTILDEIVETDDLLGAGHVGTASATPAGGFDVTAIVQFRTQGEDEEAAADFARVRLENVVETVPHFAHGRIASVTAD